MGPGEHGRPDLGRGAGPGGLAPLPFEPGAELLEMARDVGAALDLHLYGVDVLLGEAGPVVVDVNDFPGYRRIADAPALVPEHLADALSLS